MQQNQTKSVDVLLSSGNTSFMRKFKLLIPVPLPHLEKNENTSGKSFRAFVNLFSFDQFFHHVMNRHPGPSSLATRRYEETFPTRENGIANL